MADVILQRMQPDIHMLVSYGILLCGSHMEHHSKIAISCDKWIWDITTATSILYNAVQEDRF